MKVLTKKQRSDLDVVVKELAARCQNNVALVIFDGRLGGYDAHTIKPVLNELKNELEWQAACDGHLPITKEILDLVALATEIINHQTVIQEQQHV